MKIKFNNLYQEHNLIKKNLEKKFKKLFKSTDFINGTEVKIFEENLKKITKSKYAVSCGNGTDALQISLMSLDLKQNDEVIIPAFSYISIIETTVLLGLKPILVDVNYDTFNIDEKKIESKITNKTKVIVPVHLFGQNCNMNIIKRIAKKYKLFIIEDSAQSISTNYYYNSKKIQSGAIGDLGCFSFFPTKNMGCYGDGGAIITNNHKLYKKIKMIKNHGQKFKYQHDLVGVNSRLDTIQACVLNSKLKILKKNNLARKFNASIYHKILKDEKNIVLPIKLNHSDHTYHQFTIKVQNNKRDFLKNELDKNGIPSIIYYPYPMHYHRAYKKFFKKDKNYKISEKLSLEVLSLPIHPYLTKKEIEYVSNKIINILNE